CLEEVNKLVEICNKNNWEALVIDQTHPIIGFPAVRVAILPISFLTYVGHPDSYGIKKIKTNEFTEATNNLLEKLNLFSINNDLIRSEKELKQLLNVIENYLSGNLFSASVYITESGKRCDLLNLAAFINLEIGNYKDAFNYFTLLNEIHSKEEGFDTYREICDFINNNLLFCSFNNEGFFKKIFLKIVAFVNKNRVKAFLNKKSRCFEFFILSNRKNNLSDFCNNCGENCAQHLSRNLRLCMGTFFK
ncbi:MAG: hypothetical protein PHF44_04285, partial [Candidatus Pacebacteria bacterium]|nr:hypothetical protein [Candidatus Paceibacterota bacterium]